MDWIYRFTANDDYPNPLEEIAGLAAIDDEGYPTFLLLNRHKTPPMSGAAGGEVVGLCTSSGGRVILHGTAVVVAKPQVHPTTPPSVVGLYGTLADRMFCEIDDIQLVEEVGPLEESIVSGNDQTTFLSGQATAKRTGKARPTAERVRRRKLESKGFFGFDGFMVSIPVPQGVNEVVLGLDPTAGTWESEMREGIKKAMPSFAIRISNGSLQLPDSPVRWHRKNSEFWDRAKELRAAAVCIDGPCGTNGPFLREDYSAWSPDGSPGTRDAEVELFRRGVGLYWTTQRTVTRFKGADRWIARSLRLFNDEPGISKIETHPHGAFTFLWRAFGQDGTPPKKTTEAGGEARIAILRKFLPGLTNDMVDDHDAVDAAVSALVMALHRLGKTTSFGNEARGGLIWMPDIEDCVRIADGGGNGL